MKKKYTLLLATLISVSLFAQKDHCKCFDKETYAAFVKSEQHQNVTEGNDAELTVLLSKALDEDITITYEVIGASANIKTDIELPANNTFTIPKGQTQATIHIPTNNDGIRELDETFTIKILSGVTATTKKSLNNNNLVRTRTIIDSNSETLKTSFYLKNGKIKSDSDLDYIEVRNFNGILLQNQNLSKGVTYLIKAKSNNQSVIKTVVF
ncbi:hypothetical protein ACXGQW_03780 [Wenyingzhuangia sp. IMCC45533]